MSALQDNVELISNSGFSLYINYKIKNYEKNFRKYNRFVRSNI